MMIMTKMMITTTTKLTIPGRRATCVAVKAPCDTAQPLPAIPCHVGHLPGVHSWWPHLSGNPDWCAGTWCRTRCCRKTASYGPGHYSATEPQPHRPVRVKSVKTAHSGKTTGTALDTMKELPKLSSSYLYYRVPSKTFISVYLQVCPYLLSEISSFACLSLVLILHPQYTASHPVFV